MIFVDPIYSNHDTLSGMLYATGMVDCPRKANNQIAVGRCMLMRKEDKKTCKSCKCKHLKKKYEIKQPALLDSAVNSKWDNMEKRREEQEQEENR